MSSLADVNIAMRDRVTHLERRYGRKRVYLVSGIVAILVVLSAIRVITSRQKAAPPPPVCRQARYPWRPEKVATA